MDNKSFNNDIHLTYEELVGYSKGNLSNREMHRLELHLINCDFCNEAIDGIAKVDEAALSKELANIRARTEIKTNKRFSLNSKQVIALAASVALIAVVSIIFIFLPGKQDPMLAEKMPEQEKRALAEDTSSKKTEDANYNIATNEDTATAVVEGTVRQNAVSEVQPNEVNDEETIDLNITDLPAEVADIADASDTTFLAGNISQEISVDETVTEAAEIEPANADTEGAIIAETEAEEDKAVAAQSKKVAAPAAAQEMPALQEASPTEYKAAEPEKGLRSFSRYLKRNLNYPDAAKENSIEGDVVLELTINEFGSVTDIKVVQSLGYGCDQEAIRLVREGPKWLPGTANNSTIEDKVRVTVPFKL